MKKSEYLEARTKHHEGEPWLVPAKNRAHADVEAAEAAGVKWDPEEPELPERLEMSQTGSVGVVNDKADGYTTVWYIASPSKYYNFSPAFLSQEVVRRYNLYPALVAFAENLKWRVPDIGAVDMELKNLLERGK